MPSLDCHDVDSALRSLSDVLDVAGDDLRAAIARYDADRFADYSDDPQERMPRELVAALGRDIAALDVAGASYFHGTRVVDPSLFEHDGILPLDQMVERIWPMLHELVSDVCDADKWARFRQSVETTGGGHDGELYRFKLGDRLHHGPYATLVRELFFDPDATASHDYLGCPEIVQDVARCFQTAYGIDLEARFCAAAVPVIVKFKSTDVWSGAFAAALWYVFAKLRNAELTPNASGGFNGHGRAVPPEDIVEVELVDSQLSI